MEKINNVKLGAAINILEELLLNEKNIEKLKKDLLIILRQLKEGFTDAFGENRD